MAELKHIENKHRDLGIEEKCKNIEKHFQAILETLGLNLKEDSLRDTPKRIAKMYVKELFYGLEEGNKPKISLFDNTCEYNQILIEKDIQYYSMCEHHFLPFFGKVHIGYMPEEKLIGLSKINRLVNYFASRPQLQERLTMQIFNELQKSLQIKSIAVWVEATHFCVCMRGIKDYRSSTVSTKYSGKFLEEKLRKEFIENISHNSNL